MIHIAECPVGDGFCTFRNHIFRSGSAAGIAEELVLFLAVKHAVNIREGCIIVRNSECLQELAVCKCLFVKGFKRIRKIKHRKQIAAVKSSNADMLYILAKLYAVDIVKIVECTVTDGGHTVLYHDLLDGILCDQFLMLLGIPRNILIGFVVCHFTLTADGESAGVVEHPFHIGAAISGCNCCNLLEIHAGRICICLCGRTVRTVNSTVTGNE